MSSEITQVMFPAPMEDVNLVSLNYLIAGSAARVYAERKVLARKDLLCWKMEKSKFLACTRSPRTLKWS
jgi:hypothetical protein